MSQCEEDGRVHTVCKLLGGDGLLPPANRVTGRETEGGLPTYYN